MTKILPIIHIDRMMYAIDQATLIQEGDYARHTNNDVGRVTSIKKDKYVMMVLPQNIIVDGLRVVNSTKIIATTNLSLSLPLIPLEDDTDEIAVKKAAQIGIFGGLPLAAFCDGYKAAKGDKKWTDKDMRNAIRKARETTLGNNWKYEAESTIINSLQQPKLLKAIEIEMNPCMEERCLIHTCNGMCKPKLKDNHVIITNYIYNE